MPPTGAPPDQPVAAPLPAPGPLIGPWFQSVEGVRAFHEAARDALLDLAAAAREGARRPRKRVLSRAEIRRQARDGYAQLASLLDLAVAALAGSRVPGLDFTHPPADLAPKAGGSAP